MSFRCEKCGKAQEAGTQPTKVVAKTRTREYPERYKTGYNGRPILIDAGGKGWEIVQEQLLCPTCLKET